MFNHDILIILHHPHICIFVSYMHKPHMNTNRLERRERRLGMYSIQSQCFYIYFLICSRLIMLLFTDATVSNTTKYPLYLCRGHSLAMWCAGWLVAPHSQLGLCLGWYGQLIRDLRRRSSKLRQPAHDRVATAAKLVAESRLWCAVPVKQRKKIKTYFKM